MPPGRRGTNKIGLCLLCLFLCSFVAAFPGCGIQPDPDVRITFEVEPQPPRVGQVTITVSVTRSGNPITGAQIKFELNMSHAGMGPVFAEAREVEPGQYRANAQLTMAGDWSLFVSVNMPDGTRSYQSFDIKGVAPA